MMAKVKNSEPIITHAAILAMAGQHIQSEIIKLRNEAADLAKKLELAGQQNEVEYVRNMFQDQLPHHMKQLRAVETLYRIETGTELGYSDEIDEEG